jgi:hypothetical protein
VPHVTPKAAAAAATAAAAAAVGTKPAAAFLWPDVTNLATAAVAAFPASVPLHFGA